MKVSQTRFMNQLGYLASCFLAGEETEVYLRQIFYVSTNVLFRLWQLLARAWWAQLLLRQATSLLSVLVCFLRLWPKPLTKGSMGRQGLISSCILQLVHHQGNWGQGLKTRTWLQKIMKCPREVLLTDLLSRACSVCFLIKTQDHQPRNRSTRHGLGSPPSITN